VTPTNGIESEGTLMTVAEFLNRVSAQPAIMHERMVHIWGPTLKALFESQHGMSLAELHAHPDQKEELRQFRYGHLVGPELARREIDDWQSQWPKHKLPADVVDLLTQVNGIHLWADLDVGDAYFGILPLQNWQDVAQWDWREMYRSKFEGHLVISYHGNSDEFLTLDTRSSKYLLCDIGNLGVPPEPVATTVEELLDWWWGHAETLDPRRPGPFPVPKTNRP
jgi:hypothetical protein